MRQALCWAERFFSFSLCNSHLRWVLLLLHLTEEEKEACGGDQICLESLVEEEALCSAMRCVLCERSPWDWRPGSSVRLSAGVERDRPPLGEAQLAFSRRRSLTAHPGARLCVSILERSVRVSSVKGACWWLWLGVAVSQGHRAGEGQGRSCMRGPRRAWVVWMCGAWWGRAAQTPRAETWALMRRGLTGCLGAIAWDLYSLPFWDLFSICRSKTLRCFCISLY